MQACTRPGPHTDTDNHTHTYAHKHGRGQRQLLIWRSKSTFPACASGSVAVSSLFSLHLGALSGGSLTVSFSPFALSSSSDFAVNISSCYSQLSRLCVYHARAQVVHQTWIMHAVLRGLTCSRTYVVYSQHWQLRALHDATCIRWCCIQFDSGTSCPACGNWCTSSRAHACRPIYLYQLGTTKYTLTNVHDMSLPAPGCWKLK